MAVFTEARYGFKWNYAVGDTGWGDGYNYTQRALDALLCAYAISDSIATPPGSPADSDTYIVPTGAAGAWSGQAGKIAAFQGGVWEFYTPPTGFRAYILSRTGFYWWNASSWVAEPSGGSSSVVTSVAARTGDVVLTSSDISGFTISVQTILAYGTNTYIGWSALNPSLQSVPVAFVIPGKPNASQIYNVVITQASTLPANFAGVRVYTDTGPASSATFTVKKIAGGTTVTTIGTIVKTTTNKVSATLSTQIAVSFAVGDVLQLVAPSVQDSTMAEIGITIPLLRV